MTRSLRCALLAAALTLPAATAPPALATVEPRSASLEAGTLEEFDQASSSAGSLGVSSERAASGGRSVRAAYGGGGANGYARGVFNVAWPEGSDVTYSSSFYLPSGFKQSMQGQVALMRWDNWPSYGNPGADAGGIVLYGSDKRARLVRSRYGGEQTTLVGPLDLPEGRWFTLSVHQRLSQAKPYSAVLLDGRLVGSSAAPNSYGRGIERLRFGLVAIGAGQQANPLTLWFDDARVAAGAPAVPPLTDPAPAPEQPAPAPSPTPAPNQPPAVRITKPGDGASVRNRLQATAVASDDRGVARVAFLVDGTLRHTDRSAPFTWDWKGVRKLATGKHTLRVRAYDATGLSASDAITFTRARG